MVQFGPDVTLHPSRSGYSGIAERTRRRLYATDRRPMTPITPQTTPITQESVRATVRASPRVSVSIVSHGNAALVDALLADLRRVLGASGATELILTLNVPEPEPTALGDLPFAARVIRNPAPRGFGANHNAAFRLARGEFFCVLNPDVRLDDDPFEALIDCLDEPGVAVAAPQILSGDGRIEDSARRFPTPLSILGKALRRGEIRLDYPPADRPFRPDWTAGMFMLFRSAAFREIGGFDEGYHLYYEDVDICARLRRRGKGVVVTPAISVTHQGDRRSRRDLRYLSWHLASMARYFSRYPLGGPK